MRIARDRSIIARLKPEFTDDAIQLTANERDILEKALAICSEAGQLQTKIDSDAQIDDCQNNSFEWARIYLAEALNDLPLSR